MDHEPADSPHHSMSSGSVTTNSNWRSNISSMRDRFTFIFNNDLYVDTYFICGQERQRIPANRFILSTASIVFDTMFSERWSSERTNEIELPDIEPPEFLQFLRFIYSENAIFSNDNVWSVLNLAKMYDVEALKNQCIDFIKYTITRNNACFFLMKARKLNEDNLVDLCFEVINSNAWAATYTFDKERHDFVDSGEGFLDIDIETLQFIIQRNELQIEEIKLFDAMLRWANNQCDRENLPVNPENQKSVLRGAERLIRYTLMPQVKFGTKVVQSGLLSEEDILSVFLYHNMKPRPSSNFNDEPRSFIEDPLSMNISVRYMGRESVTLRVKPSDTVESVMQKVIDKWGEPGCQQGLFLESQRLANSRTLQEYNITEGSRLDLIFQLRDVCLGCKIGFGIKPYFSRED